MTIAERERAHVRLTEMPLMMVEAGAASRCIAGADICGDTFSLGQLQDGRFVAALSDGMGHGNQAALESRQAVELLRMCLDAGYDRAQTLTAVNGMMLLEGRGEGLNEVELLLVQGVTGQARRGGQLPDAVGRLVAVGRRRAAAGDTGERRKRGKADAAASGGYADSALRRRGGCL